MGLDGIPEGLVCPERRHNPQGDLIGVRAVLDPLAVALAHVAVVVLHDVVDIVGVAERRPHQAHEALVLAQPLADHVHVDVAERAVHDRLVGLDPHAGAADLRPPQEADGALGLGQAALADERVQDAGDFQDGRAARGVVVGPELGDALEQVGREDDLAGGRIGPRDDGDDVLVVVFFLFRIDDRVDRDLLVGHQALLEEVAFPDGKLEAELGLGRRCRGGRRRRRLGRGSALSARAASLTAALPADAGPGHLERIQVRPRLADGDDAQGALLLAGVVVDLSDRAFGDDDFAFDLGRIDLRGCAAADPGQFGRDVGRLASRRQHGNHVEHGGQLLVLGFHLPKLALDAVPDLAAGEFHQLGLDAILFQAFEDDLGFHERAGVFVGQPVPVVAVDVDDRVQGRFAGRLADDLVHVFLGQERPVQPGRVLGRCAAGEQDQGRPADQGQNGPADDDAFFHEDSSQVSGRRKACRSKRPPGLPISVRHPR